jgi:hypothetical protein
MNKPTLNNYLRFPRVTDVFITSNASKVTQSLNLLKEIISNAIYATPKQAVYLKQAAKLAVQVVQAKINQGNKGEAKEWLNLTMETEVSQLGEQAQALFMSLTTDYLTHLEVTSNRVHDSRLLNLFPSNIVTYTIANNELLKYICNIDEFQSVNYSENQHIEKRFNLNPEEYMLFGAPTQFLSISHQAQRCLNHITSKVNASYMINNRANALREIADIYKFLAQDNLSEEEIITVFKATLTKPLPKCMLDEIKGFLALVAMDKNIQSAFETNKSENLFLLLPLEIQAEILKLLTFKEQYLLALTCTTLFDSVNSTLSLNNLPIRLKNIPESVSAKLGKHRINQKIMQLNKLYRLLNTQSQKTSWPEIMKNLDLHNIDFERWKEKHNLIELVLAIIPLLYELGQVTQAMEVTLELIFLMKYYVRGSYYKLDLTILKRSNANLLKLGKFLLHHEAFFPAYLVFSIALIRNELEVQTIIKNFNNPTKSREFRNIIHLWLSYSLSKINTPDIIFTTLEEVDLLIETVDKKLGENISRSQWHRMSQEKALLSILVSMPIIKLNKALKVKYCHTINESSKYFYQIFANLNQDKYEIDDRRRETNLFFQYYYPHFIDLFLASGAYEITDNYQLYIAGNYSPANPKFLNSITLFAQKTLNQAITPVTELENAYFKVTSLINRFYSMSQSPAYQSTLAEINALDPQFQEQYHVQFEQLREYYAAIGGEFETLKHEKYVTDLLNALLDQQEKEIEELMKSILYSKMPKKRKLNLLAARDSQGTPGLYHAMSDKKLKAVSLYVKTVLKPDSDLTYDEKFMLLEAKTLNGISAIYQVLLIAGEVEVGSIFIKAVLDAELSNVEILHRLMTYCDSSNKKLQFNLILIAIAKNSEFVKFFNKVEPEKKNIFLNEIIRAQRPIVNRRFSISEEALSILCYKSAEDFWNKMSEVLDLLEKKIEADINISKEGCLTQ